MKKIITLVLASIFTLSTFSGDISIRASESRNENTDGYRYYSKDETNEMLDDIASTAATYENDERPNKVPIDVQKEEIAKQLHENFDKQLNSRIPVYDSYRTENPTVKYATAEGYADKQPANGYTRNPGDILFWNPSGGTAVDVSVSFGYKSFGFSVGLGFGGSNSVGSGFVVREYGEHKIYVIKDYKVSNPNMYGHPYNSPAGTWVRIDQPATKTYNGDRTYLKKL